MGIYIFNIATDGARYELKVRASSVEDAKAQVYALLDPSRAYMFNLIEYID